MVQVLNQGQYAPAPVEKQVMSLWAVTNGLLDDLPVADSKRFETGFLEFMDLSHPEIGQGIKESGDLNEEAEVALRSAVEEYKKTFAPSGGPAAPKEAAADELTDEEQETIRTHRRTRQDFEETAGPAGEGSQGAP